VDGLLGWGLDRAAFVSGGQHRLAMPRSFSSLVARRENGTTSQTPSPVGRWSFRCHATGRQLAARDRAQVPAAR
jgi:hypothetical protein